MTYDDLAGLEFQAEPDWPVAALKRMHRRLAWHLPCGERERFSGILLPLSPAPAIMSKTTALLRTGLHESEP
jgi:hypothetical protein